MWSICGRGLTPGLSSARKLICRSNYHWSGVDVSLNGHRRPVRSIGIDTREVYGGEDCGGPQASKSMKRLLHHGDGRFEIDRTYDGGEEILVLARPSRLMPEGDARIERRRFAKRSCVRS
jgi:hypothetical protein